MKKKEALKNCIEWFVDAYIAENGGVILIDEPEGGNELTEKERDFCLKKGNKIGEKAEKYFHEHGCDPKKADDYVKKEISLALQSALEGTSREK